MANLVIPDNFKRVLRKKERALQEAVMECVQRLADDPTHPGLQVHPVHGVQGVWEAYVDRANRVTFMRPGNGEIVLRNNCNHDILKRRP